MIITPSYAIGHIPRTGGDTLLTYIHGIYAPLKSHTGWWFENMGHDTKHNTFVQQGSSVAGRKRVLTIRRLPSFMWACANFFAMGTAVSGRQALPTKQQMLDPATKWGGGRFRNWKGGCFATLPDAMLRPYLDKPVDHYLRMEHLVEDTIKFYPRLFGKKCPQKAVKFLENRGGKQCYRYPHNYSSIFSPEDVFKMYENNPLWMAAELEAYGDLQLEYQPVAFYDIQQAE